MWRGPMRRSPRAGWWSGITSCTGRITEVWFAPTPAFGVPAPGEICGGLLDGVGGVGAGVGELPVPVGVLGVGLVGVLGDGVVGVVGVSGSVEVGPVAVVTGDVGVVVGAPGVLGV